MLTMNVNPLIESTLARLDVADETRQRLAAMARSYEAPTRELLLRKGDVTAELSILVTGRAVLTEHTPGQGSIRHATLDDGDIFGWSTMIEPYRAVSDVVSLTPVEVIAFDGEALRAAMLKDDSLAADVNRLLVEALAERLVATRHELFDLYGKGWTEPIFEPW
jgi:CRP/FNR family cyclic AMP-dependent transcriptional regulator